MTPVIGGFERPSVCCGTAIPSLRERNERGGIMSDDDVVQLGRIMAPGGKEPSVTNVVDATRTPRVEPAAILAQRIRAEYEEMPGLTLTLVQATRLWGKPLRELEPVLVSLVREGFLMRGPKGAYRRSGCPRCS